MSTSSNPHQEQPNTYFVQDRSNEEEMQRLLVLDQLLTAGMGGALPEQPDPTAFRRVLDVGCGTGGWLREVARTYPNIAQLMGIDISNKMIEYARARTQAEELSDKVELHVMDALRWLEFPVNYFDLVNHRAAASWLRTWDWPNILQQYQRVCKPDGTIRVTEVNFTMESNSPALNRLSSMLQKAFHQSGHYFTDEGDGVINQLARLLHQHGLQHVQTYSWMLEYRAGTPEGQDFFEVYHRAYRTSLPFMRKWLHVPDDYEVIYQQAVSEMQQPDFVSPVKIVTAWGKKP